jgi:hypothetical protein
MVISASRRTDIPAFYSQWFYNRLKEGFVLVQNPMNPKMISRISLTPGIIDCIVFWTRNPKELMKRLDELDEYHYYFLFTITAYGRDLEWRSPSKNEAIDTFIELSRKIGKEKVIWRYDPILLSDKIDDEFHVRNFGYIAERLHSYTERCIISFLDMYKKCERNLKGFHIKNLDANDMIRVAKLLHRTAERYGIKIVTCAEEIDFTDIGISPGACIDGRLISRICGHPLDSKKDKNQRKTCRCMESVDIGAYNSCSHICLYCYANTGADSVEKNRKLHNPDSPLLIGELPAGGKLLSIGLRIQDSQA